MGTCILGNNMLLGKSRVCTCRVRQGWEEKKGIYSSRGSTIDRKVGWHPASVGQRIDSSFLFLLFLLFFSSWKLFICGGGRLAPQSTLGIFGYGHRNQFLRSVPVTRLYSIPDLDLSRSSRNIERKPFSTIMGTC